MNRQRGRRLLPVFAIGDIVFAFRKLSTESDQAQACDSEHSRVATKYLCVPLAALIGEWLRRPPRYRSSTSRILRPSVSDVNGL